MSLYSDKKLYNSNYKNKIGVEMKVTEFLGIRVIDKEAIEIGKVSELIIDAKEAVITGIQVTTGEFGLRKTDLLVDPSQINEVGDYLLLNISKDELNESEEKGESQGKEVMKLEKIE